jgi:DNA modification methylase
VPTTNSHTATLAKTQLSRLHDALNFTSYTKGTTHHFYHYPARFSPEFARAVIAEFSTHDSWVLDPFMGGGTSVVEAVALGRRVVGVDLNALAHFVARVRTTPLSSSDENALLSWAADAAELPSKIPLDDINHPNVRNLPRALEAFLAGAITLCGDLRFPRQRATARCALLRLGQWAMEGQDWISPRRQRLGVQLRRIVDAMIAGMREFVFQCAESGIPKNQIASRRLLFNRDTAGLETESRLTELREQIDLVVTSPPYPGVHVNYHRWQHRGRRETPAPYWIANVADGCGESFYTFGSRKVFFEHGLELGMERYAARLTETFRSVRPYLKPDALVFQLLAFPHAAKQLPAYLAAMSAAGYEEMTLPTDDGGRPGRQVPNRRWYARNQGKIGAATELLLVHRPRP